MLKFALEMMGISSSTAAKHLGLDRRFGAGTPDSERHQTRSCNMKHSASLSEWLRMPEWYLQCE